MPNLSTRRRLATTLIATACAATGAVTVAGPASATTTTTSVTTNEATVGTTTGTFAYAGSWATSKGTKKYLKTDRYSSSTGSSYTFRFKGTSVSLFGAKAPHHGQATVVVDGGVAQVVDQYASSRKDNVLLYTSPTLAPGEHVVKVTVRGTRNAASRGTVIAVDRAVAKTTTTTTTTTTAPTTAPTVTTEPTAPAVFAESGDGPDVRPYASTTLNGTNPLWHVESGSAAVNRIGGSVTKVDTAQFHRMFSTKRFGGPGKTLTISYRGRATAIRDRAGSSIVEGAKIGLKFPASQELTGYSKEDPRSVYGTSTQSDPKSPGSYALVTGLTEGGYMELARNGYGGSGYQFFANKRVGYTPGTWKDVTVTVEWLSGSTVRVRYWHNADGSGTPVYEATDTSSPFAAEAGFLWLRSDDADWEYDHFTIREH